MLIWNKVGKYSNMEFDLAYKLFHEKKLPRVYVYEKAPVKETTSEEDKKSKQDFLSKLNRSGKEQFQSPFKNMDTVILKFKDNIQRLFDNRDEHHFVYGKHPRCMKRPQHFFPQTAHMTLPCFWVGKMN